MSTFETARTGLLWDSTALPNAFICEYMPSAPEGYVKVYLYGLMLTHSGIAEDSDLLDEISRALYLDRTEVERAFRFWERRQLVERIQDNPPRYRYIPITLAYLQREQLPRDEEYEAFAEAIYSAFGDRRKLHGNETVLAYEWVEQYKLPPEIVLMLIQHMIATRGINFSFKEAQKVAIDLFEAKVETLAEAEEIFSRSFAAIFGAKKVLSHLGMRRNPTKDEKDLYIKWTNEWGFTPDAIMEACKKTTSSYIPNFAYLDKILEKIHNQSSETQHTESNIRKAINKENAETTAIREILHALGIPMPVIDEGLRLEYRNLIQYGGHELCLLATREVVSHSKIHSLYKVRQLLDSWSKKGLTTVESATAYLAEVDMLNSRIRELMAIANSEGGCTLDNRTKLTQWQSEWHMPQVLIELAAEFARGTAKPMQFMHKLLSDWHAQSIANVEEARASHERHLSGLSQKPSVAAPTQKRVIEQQYEQRTYDPDDLNAIPPELLEEMKKL